MYDPTIRCLELIVIICIVLCFCTTLWTFMMSFTNFFSKKIFYILVFLHPFSSCLCANAKDKKKEKFFGIKINDTRLNRERYDIHWYLALFAGHIVDHKSEWNNRPNLFSLFISFTLKYMLFKHIHTQTTIFCKNIDFQSGIYLWLCYTKRQQQR